MSAPKSPLEQRLKLAVQIATEAGELTLDYFRTGVTVERKGDDSPVTIADREAEKLLRRRIEETFPDDAILGEEFPEKDGANEFRWILDPIDGTKSFIHGVPLYGTLIGIEMSGEASAGVIRIPALDQTVFAAVGSGAWHIDGDSPAQPAKVSSCERLAESLFVTSEVICFDEVGRREAFDRLQEAARLTRTWGDAYGYFMVATGQAELMVDPYLSAWDAAPMLPVLREAGGTFTDWQGNPTIHGNEAIGTNGAILKEVLAIAREYPKKG